jgi:N4-gp56 family major capsid protein
MAGEIKSTTTTLNDLLSPIVQEAMFVANEKSLLRGLVKNFTVPRNSGKVLQVPIYPVSTASALTEADDLTPSAVSTNVANITLAEVGLMTNVSDLSLNYSESNVIADVGKLFGEAIALKMDQDIAALFDSFTTTVLGDGTTAITPAKIFEAVAKLRALSVPMDGMVCVLHPEVAYDIKSTLTSTFAAPASMVGNEAMRTGLIGNLAGIPVYESAAITSTTGDSKGAVFHRDAIGLAVAEDIKIETQRDASARATELVGVATFGVNQIHETYGAEMNFDSSIVNP